MTRFPAFGFMIAGMAVLLASDPVCAQSEPPPALTTVPAPPPAGRPFEADFHYFWYGAAFGIVQDRITVDGATVTVPFNHGCGFICPGTRAYLAFPFQMPALEAGSYRINIVYAGDDMTPVASFPLAVGAVVATPASSRFSLMVLALLAATLACLRMAVHEQRPVQAHRGFNG
jgi:hypothetical protein